MKLNIFFRLEKAWFGARKKLVSSLNYEFCYGENLTLNSFIFKSNTLVIEKPFLFNKNICIQPIYIIMYTYIIK